MIWLASLADGDVVVMVAGSVAVDCAVGEAVSF